MTLTDDRVVDLRRVPVDHVLDRVEQRLGTVLDRAGVVRKRRSVGARSDRGSWVRVERRPWERARAQGWNGIESAAAVMDVAMPTWWGSVVWQDPADGAIWRADETTLLPDCPVGTAVVATAPELSSSWWRALNSSLDALAGQTTVRVATPDTELITEQLVDATIRAAFPEAPNAVVERWVPAHADLNWANVTGPEFCLFDWEDWGLAPRGLDSATLLAASLAVPDLADRVRHERRADLESRDGKVMRLFVLAKIAGPHAHPDDPRVGPARREADQLVRELHPA
ncbi:MULTISPECIES: hypothetical protein [unclassified Kitasatospora]|uniref:hypothetical protein n=1 Tax=unclassified Kitasatospora TaxID=2633591 RepID=UPI00070D52EC|nr:MULTISPECIES: hypothetical protein [unclassified Kitasatospora]KQV20979.1 hypothetical protein ASC99_20165 [Kitasatospora sp. Root107]KRB60535.1 hypothetical protein ASE03_13010 [Kitasatospora sp. Root187]